MRAPARLRTALLRDPRAASVAASPRPSSRTLRLPGPVVGPLVVLAVALATVPAQVAPAQAAPRQDPASRSTPPVRPLVPGLPSTVVPVLPPAPAAGDPAAAHADEADPDEAGGVGAAATVSRGATRSAPSAAAAAAAATRSWTGYAFDACRAPSRRVMDRWRVTSPFLGVGIYIGGALRACPQRHLTPGWVRHQVEHGWKLLPIWVGPQAGCTGYDTRIASRPGARRGYPAARAQGVREARRARAAAVRLGLGAGSTLWYDLEWFPAYRRQCRTAALHFLSSWTEELHRVGYRSGVYSSVSAGIAVLGRARADARFTTPDRVWFAWANGRPDVAWRKYVPAARWRLDDRVHQYVLDVTARYGGVRMAIDRNFVDLGSSPRLRRAPAACGRVADRRHYRTVRRGDRGPSVAILECLLRAAGHYRGEVRGAYDAEVRAAVRAFQRQRGLRRPGRVDERTWTALLAAGPRTVLKRGSEGPSVRRVQRSLTAALAGAVRVHGHFGPGTASAVRRYQARTGLRATGVVTPATWHALGHGHAPTARPHRKTQAPERGPARTGRAHAAAKHHQHPKVGKTATKRGHEHHGKRGHGKPTKHGKAKRDRR